MEYVFFTIEYLSIGLITFVISIQQRKLLKGGIGIAVAGFKKLLKGIIVIIVVDLLGHLLFVFVVDNEGFNYIYFCQRILFLLLVVLCLNNKYLTLVKSFSIAYMFISCILALINKELAWIYLIHAAISYYMMIFCHMVRIDDIAKQSCKNHIKANCT